MNNFCFSFAGGNIVFGDGHAAWFKYSYVCEAIGSTIVDPGVPDINWMFTGLPSLID